MNTFSQTDLLNAAETLWRKAAAASALPTILKKKYHYDPTGALELNQYRSCFLLADGSSICDVHHYDLAMDAGKLDGKRLKEENAASYFCKKYKAVRITTDGIQFFIPPTESQLRAIGQLMKTLGTLYYDLPNNVHGQAGTMGELMRKLEEAFGQTKIAVAKPELNFEWTDENGIDCWEIRYDNRPIGQVFIGRDTDQDPPQPYINSISIVEDYRHQGIGRQIIPMLAEKYGSLTSDPGGNTTVEAHSMWRAVPGVRQIPTDAYGKEINVWKVGGKLLEMPKTQQPASDEQKRRMKEFLSRGYTHAWAAEMLGLEYTPMGKLVRK